MKGVALVFGWPVLGPQRVTQPVWPDSPPWAGAVLVSSALVSYHSGSNYFAIFHVARITAGLPDRPPSPPDLRITRTAVLMPGHRLL